MKTLRNLEIAGGLLLAGTGVPAAVGDQITMYLDTDANADFPESIVGIIQHPIVKVRCGSYVSYSVEYDEGDLDGAVEFLHPQDVVDTVLIVQADIIAAALDVEIARALAAEALLAPKASPTFTGTVTLPSTTSIGTVSSVEIGYLDGVTSAIQTQINLKAPLASPTFTGTLNLSGFRVTDNYVEGVTLAGVDSLNGIGYFQGLSVISGTVTSELQVTGSISLNENVSFALGTTIGTKIGTSTTQKLAFHNSTPVIQRAGAAQALVTGTVGAAVVTTAPTLSAHGYTLTQATDLLARVNSLIVDSAAQTVLINEIRAALVEKGLIKGAA